MLRNNDKEIDALFKEGAEHSNFPFNEEAWKMMDAKLDEADQKRRMIWWILSGIILMAFIGLTLNVFNNDTNSIVEKSPETQTEIFQEKNINENEEPTKEIASSILSDQEPSKVKNVNTQQTKVEKIKARQEANQTIAISEEEPNTYFSSVNYNREAKTENKNSIAKGRINESSRNSSSTALSKVKRALPATSGLNTENTINRSTEDTAKKPSDFAFEDRDNVEDVENLETKILSPIQSMTSQDYIELVKDVNPVPANFKSSPRFAVGLFAAPEFSSVGLLERQKLGFSFGTKLGYQFSDKFEISLGIGYSRKIYDAAGKEYTMTDGWYADIEPMQMDAKCHIIEFPLAVNYYINGFQENGFFTEIGISSYMLHSEWYGFEYDQALQRPESIVEVVENNKNKHLVGVGRLAVGYQKVLSNQSSFQVSPYIQFPLTGIGAGQVDLYNMGIQFSLKFNTK